DRPQLPRIAEPLAQNARVRIGAPVAELRKLERDDVEMRELVRDRFRRFVAAKLDAYRVPARGERVAVRAPLLEGNDDGAVVGNLVRSRHVRERVVDEIAVSNQPAHAAASSAPYTACLNGSSPTRR